MKCFVLSILFLTLFVTQSNAQCAPGTDGQVCKQVEFLRGEIIKNNDKKLDRMIEILASINANLEATNKLLQANNVQTESTANSASTTNTRLTEAMTQIRQQNEQANQILQNLIIERFKSLPADMLANPLFKAEIDKLKEDILKEIEKRKP